MKKKVVCSLLAAAMAVSMTACGSGSASTAASTSGSSGTSSTSAAADSSAEAASTSSGSTEAEAVTSGSTAAEAIASASTAATGESAAVKATGDKPTIAFVPKVMGQAWWDYVQKSVESWSSEAGIDVIYKGPTEIDAAAQVQIMTDLVNQGVDILCFSPNDPDACEAICKQARDKGIIVIATEASGMKNVDYDVEAFDETGMGAFLMDELAKQMGEKGKYVTMVGSLTMESQNNWADAAIAEQEKKYPDMTYLDPPARLVDNSDADEAYNQTKQLLTQYPDVTGICGTGSFDAPGAARAIEEMGLTGKVFAISVALPSEVGNYLENGTLQSVALWDPGISAKVMLNAGMEIFNAGKDASVIKDGMDLQQDGYHAVTISKNDNGAGLITGQGQLAITKDNYKDYSFA